MASFSQREPLTTRIRGLLEEYPVGTGILKEALQNSDDSGARTQIFILDRTSYPLSDLFDPELKRYQGPSLLLQNDSPFQESDFESLSRLGESGKREDIAKTGKFGLGFNSTYNLTDAPMILTGDQLVILEPHEEISQPHFKGGFRETFLDKKIPQNQLKPFEHSVPNGFEESFDGTIIRLPLRTKEDAARSKISNKEVSPESIMEILEAFKSEAVESLLFLKNIEKIEVYELSSSSTRKQLYSVEILDTPTIRDARSELVKALLSCTEQSKAEKSCTIDMKVSMTDYNNSKTCQTHWLIRHEVNNNHTMKVEKEFLREQKLLPWVGIAASLNFDESFSGRLFTFLPLPIFTSFPVHIQGIFGLTRDRRNLIQQCAEHPKDSKPDIIGKWNKEIFQNLIPAAWAGLLVDLTKSYYVNDQLPYWPSSTIEMQNDMCKDLLANILRRVQVDRLAVFQKRRLSSGSTPQWLSLDNTFVCAPNDLIAQILVDAGMQITCINDDIVQTLLSKNIPFSKPNPSVVRQHLRNTSSSWPSILDRPAKESLLEYLCSDKNFSDLVGLELIPLANQEFATFTTSQQEQQLVYLINSENELNLFKDWSHCLVASNQKIFIENIYHFKKYTNVQPWSFDASIQFLHERFFKLYSPSKDEIPGEAISVEYLNKLWSWIDTQINQNNSKLNSLWLIPTAHGKLRKVSAYPTIISRGPLISHEQNGVITGLLDNINVSFLHEDFTENLSGYLKSFGLVKDLSDISNILDWLERQSWQILDKNEANAIREHFYHCFIARPIKLSDKAKETFRKLPIFEVLVAPKCENQDALVELSSLDTNTLKVVVAISSKQVIPILDDILLVYIPDPPSEHLVRNILGIGKKEFNDFLANIVTPSLPKQPEYLLDALMEMILSNLIILRNAQKNTLCEFPFVPCSSMPHASSSVCRRAPSELVDPNYPGLTKLFLPQENIFPVGYYAKCNVLTQLQLLGMNTRLNSSLIKSRVEFFVKTWNDESTSSELKEHIHKKSLILLKQIDGPEDLHALVDLKQDISWLPATTRLGELRLVRSSECRDKRDEDLVSYTLPIVQHKLRNSKLIEFLGWNKDISVDILQKQIIGIINEPCPPEDIMLGSLLLPLFDLLEKYISQPEQLNTLKNALDGHLWIPINGKFRHTSEVVFQGSDFSLEPYIVSLPYELEKRAPEFLQYMGVQNNHMIDILKKISIGLGTTSILSEEKLKLAGRIIETLSGGKLSDNLREQILIPDTENRFAEIKDITYHNLQPTKTSDTDDQKSNYGPMVNDAISLRVAKRLKIPLLSERILNDIIDNDFIEHEQKESICTRINNTLREYTIDSTSNEFIANADDSGATTFKWIYDPYGEYSTKSLFCDEMEAWQGPSIFCYNNGLFTEDDIKALAKVGVGSKQKDSTKIGRYGLGFLSAYHWTDVPSVVSGDSAIFFDPQQKFLPYKRNSMGSKLERLGGLHIKNIGKSQASQFGDQFAPFAGLFGFNPKEHFDGTLFRFPLRNKVQAIKSDIAVNKECLGKNKIHNLLTLFFNSARKSLFFLRNIKEIEAFVLTKDRELKPLWSVSLNEPPSDILDMRKSITEKSNDMTLDICIKEFNKHDSLGSQMISNRTERWAVFSELVQVEELSLKSFAGINRMIPHIGIAAPLWTKDGTDVKKTSLPLSSFGILSPLPVSVCVGLPVHLYGCFALSSDRRSILLDAHSELGAKPKISWNEFLLRCTANLYLRALAQLASHPDRRGTYYEYWPSSKSENVIYTLAQPLYDEFWTLIWEEKHKVFEACVLNESTSSKWVSLREAIFNNPEESKSLYMELLLKHGYNNIVSLPLKLWKILCQSRNKDIMKLIDPALLRKAIKGSSNIKKLLDSKELLYDQYTNLLKYLVSDNNLKDLAGCQILLLENGSMAMLMEKTTFENNYYFATTRELQLFYFSKSQFVSSGIPREIIDLLTNKLAGLNVSAITPSVIRYFLRKLIPNSRLSKYPVKGQKLNAVWIKAFWQYWDSKSLPLDELEDIPILPVGNPPTHLVSVNHLKDLSCLQAPNSDDLRRVIQKIGRVHLVYQNELPTKSVQIQIFNLESYLDYLANTSPPTNICAYLTLDEKIILRNFVMEAANYTDFENMGQRSKNLLAELPLWYIWPENNNNLYPAKNTCLLPHPKIFFRPLHHTTFLREESKYFPMLESLGSLRLPIEEHFKKYIVPSLPQRLTPDEIDQYFKFLRNLLALQNISTVVLSGTRMIPDSNGTLHYANELLDYTVTLFHDTFILGGKDKLLHPKFKDLRLKMHHFGLHHKVDGKNFIKCAEEVERIWIDNPSEGSFHQADKVFKYLNNTNTLTFTDDECERLSIILFVPTRPSSRPFYGSDLWDNESTYPRLSCLHNLIVQEMSNIAWTQRPVFGIPPSNSLLKRSKFIGKPDVLCVFKHLCCLSEIRKKYTTYSDDAKDFINGLKATYAFLEEEHEDVGQLFKQKIDSKLFWNYDDQIDDPFDDKFWYCAYELVINADYDISSNLRRICSSLEPYPNLLKVADAKSIFDIIDPIPTHISISIDEIHRRIAFDKFYDFYRKGIKLDVEFLVLSSEGESEKIRGHQLVLAASSSYFDKLLTGPMIEGNSCICSGDPIRIEGLTPRAVRHAFEFIYLGKLNKTLLGNVPPSINNTQNQISPDNPDSHLYAYMLELLHVADRFLLDHMRDLVQDAIIKQKLVRIDTVRDLSERAKQFNAEKLSKLCEKFEERNIELVAIANRSEE